jgi:protease I
MLRTRRRPNDGTATWKEDSMSETMTNKRVAFLATDGVEQIELVEPWSAVEKAGASPELISIREGEIQGVNGMDKADRFSVGRTVAAADAREYDALVIPGGVKNPDKLRMDEAAVSFVRAFVDAGKPVAAICHGPWMLVEADVVRGRRITSYPSLRTDVRNAGGEWVDAEVCVADGLVTSRTPDDLPAFNAKLLDELRESAYPRESDAPAAAR